MSIVDNYLIVQERIVSAAQGAGRRPEEVTLVAVTKTWPAEVVVTAYRAGMRHIGENRAEELAGKKIEVESVLGPESGIVWHAIGALQSRKTNMVADYADIFHALDRLKIANRLSRQLVENGRDEDNPLPVFLEINISGESSKAGINCSRWEDDASQREALQSITSAVANLPGLKPVGLMTMAPWKVEEHVIRDVFQRTRCLNEWLQNRIPQANLTKLSMGMTDDFEIAIAEGATHVRVGRAIFGARN